MEIINSIFVEAVGFFIDKELELDLVTLIKLIDYIFASLDLDVDSEEEVQFFVQNVRVMNELFKLLGLTSSLTDQQRKAYDTDVLMSVLDSPERIIKMKEFKVSLHHELDPDLAEIFAEFRKGKF